MENYKEEIERLGEALSLKSTDKWMRGYCEARLESIATDETLDSDVRHMAAEAGKQFALQDCA